MIAGAPDGDQYVVYAMDGSESLMEENTERRIYRCDSSRSGLRMEIVNPNRKAFLLSLMASPVVDASAECRWRREECDGMK